MDLFKYTASVKEIETCKTVGGLEKLLRLYHDKCPSGSRIFPSDKQKFYYKLWTLALKTFKSKSKKALPYFLTQDWESLQTYIINSMLNAEYEKKPYFASPNFTKVPTYEEFMDWFEFDDTLNLFSSSGDVEKLNDIVKDNPIHFEVKFNYIPNEFDSYSTSLDRAHKRLLYAIRYKQVNFPNKSQTIWDMFIEHCIIEAGSTDVSEEEINTNIIKLEQQISALKALKGYWK